MSKQATRKSATPAATPAPSKASNATFEIGSYATITNGATDHQPLLCIVEAASKGWYVCRPADGSEKTISARAGSMAPAAAPALPEGEDGIEYFQSARSEPLPYEADEDSDEEDDGEDVPSADSDDDRDEEDDEADLDALDEALSVAQKMAEALRKARVRYAKTRRPSGSASADNGDKIAKELREYEPDEVARLADAVLGTAIGHHKAKYGHLNNGQIRMNSGNRIRAYYKGIAARAEKEDASAIIELQRLNRLLNLIDDEAEEQDDAE